MRSDAFRAAAEAKDLSALDELLTDDVVFRSPVVFQPYEGREALRVILTAVLEVLEGFHYVDQVETGDRAVLLFKGRAGDREVDGVDILSFDADGRVRELMVMVRPMSAMHALAEAMRAKLEELGAAAP
jgi:hypothetical protein